jgi:hypothetical protein
MVSPNRFHGESQTKEDLELSGGDTGQKIPMTGQKVMPRCLPWSRLTGSMPGCDIGKSEHKDMIWKTYKHQDMLWKTYEHQDMIYKISLVRCLGVI